MHALAVAALFAVAPHPSVTRLGTSNGWSPVVYDVSTARVVSFREHLYAQRDAITWTRELAYDLYFGLRAGGSNAWLGEVAVDEAGYDGDTAIVRVVQQHQGVTATQYVFSPFQVDGSALVVVVVVRNDGAAPLADAALFSLQNLHLGSGAQGTSAESITWTGDAYEERGEAGLALYRPLPAATHHAATPQNPYLVVQGGARLPDVDASGTTDDAVAGFEWDLAGLAPGETRTFALVVGFDAAASRASIDAALAPLAALDAAGLLAAERAGWQAFHAPAEPAGLTAAERAVYRRSLAVLRIAQVREPSAGSYRPHGQIVASPPPGNWNRTWVRDQAYATLALVRAGHLDEARASLEFLLAGGPGGYVCCDAAGGPYVGVPYALSVVRYFGDGSEESDGNANGPNVEFDGFGLTLAVLDAYSLAAGSDALVDAYDTQIFDLTADVLVSLIEDDTGLVRADSSIWETHWEGGGRKHFTYTQAAAASGLRAAARMATRRGDAARAAAYDAAADRVTAAVAARLVHPASQGLRGNAEEIDTWLDTAVVEAFNCDVLPAGGPVAQATLDALEDGLWLGFTGHGYRRNDDGGEYDEREWIVMDLRIARAARRAGRDAHAGELLAWVTDQARLNADLIPENYHPLTADYQGETPMAGFGAGAYMLALWERADDATPATPDGGLAVDAGPDAGAGATGDTGGCGCRAGSRAPVAPWWLLAFALLPPFALRAANSKGERRRRAGLLTLLLVLSSSACGLESLFSPGDYHPTPAPRVVLAFTAPAGAETAEAWDATGRLVASTPAATGTLDLGTTPGLANLRVVARTASTAVVARATIASAPPSEGSITVVLDAPATAASLLVDARVAADGATLGATPAPVTGAMLGLAAGADPALAAFRAEVDVLLAASAVPPLGAALDPAFVAADPAAAAAYATALAAALPLVAVPITCDPALVRVMFTVDLSGQALDGNGARQLIRQPPKEGRVFLGFTVDDSSPVADSAGLLPQRIIPNDPAHAMTDDGAGGDEVAGDGVYTRVVTLPRGMRVKYKYTDGSAGEPFTRTEEWPGNARILQIDDVVTRHAGGQLDCLVIRRDSFGDEASNKNFTSLHAALGAAGGTLGWDVDLGGPPATPLGDGRVVGGLALDGPRAQAPLSPQGVPEARENGVCAQCPAPLVLALDDTIAPVLLGAAFLSTSEIEVHFSEAMDFAAASDPSAYLVVDSALRALPIRSVASLGDRARLRVDGPDLSDRHTLHVQRLPDASAAANLLETPPGATSVTVEVGPDVTPPRALLARSGSRKDLFPSASLADPTTGEVVFVTFSEELEPASAEDAARYHVESILGEPLAVRGAYLVEPERVALVTDTHEKRRRYGVDVSGVRDLAGNSSVAAEPLAFDGFALYRMTTGVVPGHAFATRDGAVRGIPRGERVYLTGTPLAVARDPGDGTDLSIGGRTDVTGVPEFEMLPGADLHEGQPVYRATILVPPGVYAWKVAHGVPGEWVDPPPTLEKVTKSLGTTNDPTGVNVDPVTLVATNGVSYDGAVLSLRGDDAPGPLTLFKRENPDEICAVLDQDVDCAPIVVGTWRDLDEWIAGGVPAGDGDYDDGEPEVDPTRLVPDTAPPAPIYVQVRDSESLRVSFDEGIAAGALVQVSAVAEDGAALAIVDTQVRFPAPHEIVVRTAPQSPAGAYTLAISGLADLLGNTSLAPLEIGWTSPAVFVPFAPFEDTTPPALLGVTPETPTTLRVRFDEPLAGSAADPARFAIAPRGPDPAPSILGATLAGGDRDVLLTTTPQPLMGAFTLSVAGIADQASPANVLVAAAIDFTGFGDSTPPVLVSARAIGPGTVVLVFDEALDLPSATAAASYTVAGATVAGVEYSGDPALLATAFDPADARTTPGIVVLATSTLAPGSSHMLTTSVRDQSGNLGGGGASVTGVATAPTVNVVVSVRVSDTETVAGSVPPRALSPSRLAAEREGVFLVGIGGFPPEGSPLDGVEPRLLDDGLGADLAAGDDVYTLLVPGVPLGSVLEWKAFASYTVAWKNAHPADAAAAFADALPGPSVFSDGQEYPGNENGVLVLGDVDGDGVVRLSGLLGDETTFKKLSTTEPFKWVVEDTTYAP